MPSVQSNRATESVGIVAGGGGTEGHSEDQYASGLSGMVPHGCAIDCGGAWWCVRGGGVRVSPVSELSEIVLARCGISRRFFTFWKESESPFSGFITYLLLAGGEQRGERGEGERGEERGEKREGRKGGEKGEIWYVYFM